MHLVRRILIAVVVTLAIAFIGIAWVAPVAMSFYASRKAIPVTRVLPTDLADRSISQATGKRLSYLGHDFEVPWSDLDESKTELFPKDNPHKTMARLHFRSGLQMLIIAAPTHTFADELTKEVKMSPGA